MDKILNVHAGHRERMIEKLIMYPELFSDHELIETLLFFFIPRKDTNALAHIILNSFGSLDGVFNATPDKLKKIKGVGEKIASGIVAVGQIMKRINNSKRERREIRNFDSIKDVLFNFYKERKEEVFVVLMLDKDYGLMATQSFTNYKKDSVSIEVPELVDAFNLHKPTYAILSHNHFSGSVYPSEEDIFTTQKINVLCEINNIKLTDHVIVSGNNAFSLEREGLMAEILKSSSLLELFKKINKIDTNT